MGKGVWAAAAAGLLICGCARAGRPENKFLPQVSSIYVAKDGEIFSATVEPWEDGEYDSASLRQFITDEVAAYNESLGASALPFAEGEEAPLPVAVDSCQAGEGKLWVVYRYKDSEAFRDFAREYLRKPALDEDTLAWDFIAMAMGSVADLCIIPIQDFLCLDEKARINIPSTLGNNWVWRLKKGQITEELTKEIRRMTKLYGRIPGEG